MENRRNLIRLEVGDFLEIRALNEVAMRIQGKSANLTPMGICFSSEMEWRRGQVLMIDYFIPQEFDSIKLKVVVVWSEFINKESGYFCGGQILDIEEAKAEKFSSYYNSKIKEKTV